MDKHMDQITLALVDEWLDLILNPTGFRMLNANRESLEHEYDILRTILNYYHSYSDSYGYSNFSPPLRKRHKTRAYQKHVKLNSSRRKSLKEIYLTEEEFVLFREKIEENIENSYFVVTQYVYWPRKKGLVTAILPGFKKSKHLTGG
jgi:hypothetical protein